MATLITKQFPPLFLFLGPRLTLYPSRSAVDFASRAQQPKNVIIPQLIALPATFSIVSLFGILIASSTEVVFGEFVWSPLAIMQRLLVQIPTSATRAGVAFISIGFIIAQLGTNISVSCHSVAAASERELTPVPPSQANSISAGCDLTALFPRFINIRRGGYIAATVGFAMYVRFCRCPRVSQELTLSLVVRCPWNLLKDSNSFASYLSAYSVFLSSICGVMVSHYYYVAGRKVKVDDLYTLSSEGLYHYYHGFNLRAYAAYVCGILINVVGFAGAVGNTVPIAATRIYNLSFLTGFGVAAIVYIALNKIFPHRQPTQEENDIVTVGKSAWNGEVQRTGSFSDKEEGKYSSENAAVSPV